MHIPVRSTECGHNALYLYSGYAPYKHQPNFKPQPKYRLSCMRFLVFVSPLGKCRDSIQTGLRPLPSQPFPINHHQSPYPHVLHSLV